MITHEFRNGIFCVRIQPGATVDEAHKDALFSTFQQGAARNGGKVKAVVVYPSEADYSIPFLLRGYNDPFHEYIHTVAVVMPQTFHRTLAQAHAAAFPREYNEKLFATEEEALAWLKEVQARSGETSAH